VIQPLETVIETILVFLSDTIAAHEPTVTGNDSELSVIRCLELSKAVRTRPRLRQ